MSRGGRSDRRAAGWSEWRVPLEPDARRLIRGSLGIFRLILEVRYVGATESAKWRERQSHDCRHDAGEPSTAVGMTTPRRWRFMRTFWFPARTVQYCGHLKFLIDRTGYIKLLEAEDTPEAFSRIENLRELVNAAMDSRDRAETMDQFLDHAALISDVDDYDERAQITLMSLHAAKGLEFPLVFLSGLEEGLFPHSRTMLQPDEVEEERRLCYVGMTRAMDQLILSRAVYRRRYGTDLPEASVPSRFLEEVPAPLIEELGGRRGSGVRSGRPRAAATAMVTQALPTRAKKPIIPMRTRTRVSWKRGRRKNAAESGGCGEGLQLD